MEENKLDQISGSKGGKGGGNPTTAKDNLDSIAKIKILDALGEGDIDGFATPRSIGLSQSDTLYNTALLKDIFFDNTPVLAETASVATPSDDDFNFDDVDVSNFDLGITNLIPLTQPSEVGSVELRENMIGEQVQSYLENTIPAGTLRANTYALNVFRRFAIKDPTIGDHWEEIPLSRITIF